MGRVKIVTNERLKDNGAFHDLLSSLPEHFNDMGKVIHQARNVIRIVDTRQMGIGYDEVCVKRYHGLFFFQKWYYTFVRPPKCRRAFDYTSELRRRGFTAAEELGYVEVRRFGIFQYAYYVCQVAQGQRLDHLLAGMKENGDKDGIDTVLKQYAAMVKRLHTHGVLYWDMNDGNVICSKKPDDTQWTFTLIDTDRIRMFPPDTELDLETVIGDLILMDSKLGLTEPFVTEYLKQRDMFSEENLQRVLMEKYNRYEKKKRPVKKFLKRYRKAYYKWLEH